MKINNQPFILIFCFILSGANLVNAQSQYMDDYVKLGIGLGGSIAKGPGSTFSKSGGLSILIVDRLELSGSVGSVKFKDADGDSRRTVVSTFFVSLIEKKSENISGVFSAGYSEYSNKEIPGIHIPLAVAFYRKLLIHKSIALAPAAGVAKEIIFGEGAIDVPAVFAFSLPVILNQASRNIIVISPQFAYSDRKTAIGIGVGFGFGNF